MAKQPKSEIEAAEQIGRYKAEVDQLRTAYDELSDAHGKVADECTTANAGLVELQKLCEGHEATIADLGDKLTQTQASLDESQALLGQSKAAAAEADANRKAAEQLAALRAQALAEVVQVVGQVLKTAAPLVG